MQYSFLSAKEELPLDLLKDLYTETKDNKVLIFLIAEEEQKKLPLNSKNIG
jgi:hypothetical protein